MSAATPQDFLTLTDIVSALRSRWFGILFVSGVLSFGVLIALLLIPNTYQSDALLYVRMGAVRFRWTRLLLRQARPFL